MNKKAVVAVSFGTAWPGAERALTRLEGTLGKALAGYDVLRAYTSGMVIEKLRRERGIRVESPAECLARLAREGYGEVVCQSLHVIHGLEFEKLKEQAAPFRGAFASLRLGSPLLASEADYRAVCGALLAEMGRPAPGDALVFMGHGAAHHANAAYCQVERMFCSLGARRVFVGAVEGFPGLDDVRARLREAGVRRVTLAPFLITAGEHARHDLAGDRDSWKAALAMHGYEVSVRIRGLGEREAVGAVFARHCREAAPL